MLTFVINLDDSKDRFDVISKRLDKLGISYERMSAVNGRALTEEEVESLTYPHDHFETKVRFTRMLTRGEIGCFLSHRKCWQRLLVSDEKFAAVMEDDIEISPHAQEFLTADRWIPENVDLIQMGGGNRVVNARVMSEELKINDCFKLYRPTTPALGTLCYIISKRAARAALDMSKKLPAPVDNFMFTRWFDLARLFPVWQIAPLIVIQSDRFESIIGERSKRAVQKAPFFIRHGITRFLMDREIKKFTKSGTPYVFEFADDCVEKRK